MARTPCRALQVFFRSPHIHAPTVSAKWSVGLFLSYFSRALRCHCSRHCCVEDERRFVDKGEVAVFWDLNVSNVPDSVDPHCISPNIMHALRRNGFSGPITIHAYGNTRSLNDQEFLQALVSTGVDLHHVPGGVKDLNSRLLVDMLLWVKENFPPANLLLISRDKNFSSVMHKLQLRGYNVFWAYPDEEISSDLLGLVSKVWAWENVIRGIGVERSFASPLQVGYGPSQRYSMQHPRLDIKRDLYDSDTQKKYHGIPKDVVEKLLNIIKLRPNGFTLPALRRQLIKSNIVLDKDFYGHKDLLAFLLSIPELKASLIWTTDRTRTYVFTETGGGSIGINGNSEERPHQEKKSTIGPLEQMEEATCGKHPSSSQQHEWLLKDQVTNDKHSCLLQQRECTSKNLTPKVAINTEGKSMSNQGFKFLARVMKLLSFFKLKQNATLQDEISCIRQGSMKCSASNEIVGNSETVTDSIKYETDCKNNFKAHCAEDSKAINAKEEDIPISERSSGSNREDDKDISKRKLKDVAPGSESIMGSREICQNKRRKSIEVAEWRDEVYKDNSEENQQRIGKIAVDETPEKDMTSNMDNGNKGLFFHTSTDDDVQSNESAEISQHISRKTEQGRSQILDENLTGKIDGNRSSSKHVSKREAHRNDFGAKQKQNHESDSCKSSKVFEGTKCALSVVRRVLPSKKELESMGYTEQLWKESILYLASKEGKQKLVEENAMNSITKILMESKVNLIAKYQEKQLYELANILSSYLVPRDVTSCKDFISEIRKVDRNEKSKQQNSGECKPSSSAKVSSVESLVESIVMKDLRDMLISRFQGCKSKLYLSQVKPEFRKKYGYELDCKVLGHNTLSSLVKSFDWIVMSEDKHHMLTISLKP